MEVLSFHFVPRCYWSQIKRAHLAFEWNAKRPELVHRSCEGLSNSLRPAVSKASSSAHSFSLLQETSCMPVRLSNNMSYPKLL